MQFFICFLKIGLGLNCNIPFLVLWLCLCWLWQLQSVYWLLATIPFHSLPPPSNRSRQPWGLINIHEQNQHEDGTLTNQKTYILKNLPPSKILKYIFSFYRLFKIVKKCTQKRKEEPVLPPHLGEYQFLPPLCWANTLRCK